MMLSSSSNANSILSMNVTWYDILFLEIMYVMICVEDVAIVMISVITIMVY